MAFSSAGDLTDATLLERRLPLLEPLTRSLLIAFKSMLCVFLSAATSSSCCYRSSSLLLPVLLLIHCLAAAAVQCTLHPMPLLMSANAIRLNVSFPSGRYFLLTKLLTSVPWILDPALSSDVAIFTTGYDTTPELSLAALSPPPDFRIVEATGSLLITPAMVVKTSFNSTAWAQVITRLDAYDPMAAIVWLNELGVDDVSFLWDTVLCLQNVLGFSLSGDVYSAGYSLGSKLAAVFGCSKPPPGFVMRGVFGVAGLTANPSISPGCIATTTSPPPLLLFQSKQDYPLMPFCVDSFLAAGDRYWQIWARTFSKCLANTRSLSNAFGLISTAATAPFRAFCPPQALEPTISQDTNISSSLLRVYIAGPNCRSPMALFWTSVEHNGVPGKYVSHSYGHDFPGRLAELGGADAVDVFTQWMIQLRRVGPAAALSAYVAFAPFLRLLRSEDCGKAVFGPPRLGTGFVGVSYGPCFDPGNAIKSSKQGMAQYDVRGVKQ